MSKNYFNVVLILFCIVLFVGCRTYQINNTKYSVIKINDSLDFDSTIYTKYKPYKDSLDKIMLQAIAYLENDVEKKQPNSSLGNLMADILLEGTRLSYPTTTIDFSVVNYGGIRVPSLPKGDIKIIDAYNLMPFENYIGYMTLNFSEIQSLLDSICKKNGWPISNLTFTCHNNKASNIKINEQEIDTSKLYNVAIIDYLAHGGDGMTMLKSIKYNNSGILFRDAIIQYLKEKNRINPNTENRIGYAK